MAKYADHYTKFNAVYFLSRTDKALTTLVNTCPALPPVLACRWRRRVHRRLLQQVLQGHINYPEVQITHHSRTKRPHRTERAHGYGCGMVSAEQSCAAEVYLGENGGPCGVSTQSPAKQHHQRRYAVLEAIRQQAGLSFLRTIGTRPHGCRQALLAPLSRHAASPRDL